MNVFDLQAQIGLDTKGFTSGLKNAGTAMRKMGSTVNKGLKTAAKVGVASFAAIGTASVALGKKMVDLSNETADYGDNVDKMSQKMGISAKAYQEWDAVMQHSGASIDSLKPSMKTLAVQAQKGNDAFQKLGISQKEVASLSQEDLFSRVISGLQDMEQSSERTALASQLLGRGATELGALLNTSAKDTEAMKKRVNELGGVMSDKAVKQAAKYKDTMQDMKTAFDGLKRTLGSEFMKPIIKIMQGLTDVFTGKDKGLGKISKGIEGLLKKINEKLPKFMELAKTIVGAIGKSILDNLPSILSTGTDLVVSLINGIIEALPQIMDAGLQAVGQFALAISEALPKIAEAAGTILDTIITKLTESNEDDDTGTQIINNIATAIATAIENAPKLLEAGALILQKLLSALSGGGEEGEESSVGTQIVDSIATAISTAVETLPSLLEAGTQLITKLIDGMAAAVPTLIPTLITGIMDALLALTDTNNTGSMAQSGVGLIEGLAQGIRDTIPVIKETLPLILENITTFLRENLPDIISAAIDLFSGIAEGIIEAIPIILEALPDMIDAIITGILDNLPKMIDTFTQLLSSLIESIPAAVDNIMKKLPDLIKGIVDGLLDAVPNLVDAGVQLIGSLADAIPDIVGSILENLPMIIEGLIEGIFDHIPDLIMAGPKLLWALVSNIPEILKGIVEGLGKMFKGMFEAIGKLGSHIKEEGPKLFWKLFEKSQEISRKITEGVKGLWTKLKNAITNAFSKIKEVGPKVFWKLFEASQEISRKMTEGAKGLWTKLKNAITGAFSKITEIGSDLIEGLWNGIKDMGQWIKDKLSGFFGGIMDGIKDFFGISSPSKLFAWIGKMNVLGLEEGWADEFGNFEKMVYDDLDFDAPMMGLGLDGGALESIMTVEKADDPQTLYTQSLLEDIKTMLVGIDEDMVGSINSVRKKPMKIDTRTFGRAVRNVYA